MKREAYECQVVDADCNDCKHFRRGALVAKEAWSGHCLKFDRETRAYPKKWTGAMKNTDGFQIRAAVVCWVFLAHPRPINEAQLAAGFGKHKQSVGRWVAKFKEKFPRIRIAHMKDSA